MFKLKKLLTESDAENSDMWDDWYSYLNDVSYGIEKEEIIKLINKYNLDGKKLLGGKIIKLWDAKRTAYLEFDETNATVDLIKDIEQWVYDLQEHEYSTVGINPDTIHNSWIESTLEDLRKNPGKVYHYTTEDKWEEIQQDGQMVGSRGTGINNRGAYGIFTSTDPQEYVLGSYGNVCLELDLETYKTETGKLELNLSFEPQVEEYLVREYLRSALEIETGRDDIDNDGGISPYTVIVRETIPTKYIRQIE